MIDKAGNEATTSIVICVDKTPPEVKITSPKNESKIAEPKITVKWEAKDNYGIAEIVLIVDEKAVELDPWVREYGVTLSSYGRHTIVIKVVDKAGNEASEMLVVLCSNPLTIQKVQIIILTGVIAAVASVITLRRGPRTGKSSI